MTEKKKIEKSEKPITPEATGTSLNQIMEDALKLDTNLIAPEEGKKTWHSSDEIDLFINEISILFGISTPHAFAAIVMLFNKGAANNNTPRTLGVTILIDNTQSFIDKDGLMYTYRKLFKTNYIRRMAESMSDLIGKYSEIKNLEGELTKGVNRIIASKTEATSPLSPKEAAWCSSFHQNNTKAINAASSRLGGLLAEDYLNRTKEITKNKKTKKQTNQAPNKKVSGQNKKVSDQKN